MAKIIPHERPTPLSKKFAPLPLSKISDLPSMGVGRIYPTTSQCYLENLKKNPGLVVKCSVTPWS